MLFLPAVPFAEGSFLTRSSSCTGRRKLIEKHCGEFVDKGKNP